MKAFFLAIWERVFVHYKPTLIGLGIAALAFVVEYVGQSVAGLPAGWAKFIAAVAVPLGAFLKQKAATYPQPVP